MSAMSIEECKSVFSKVSDTQKHLEKNYRNQKGEFSEPKGGTKKDLIQELHKIYSTICSVENVLNALINSYDSAKELKEKVKVLEGTNRRLHTENDKLQEYSDIFGKINEHLEDMKDEMKKDFPVGVTSDSSENIKKLVSDET